MSKYKITDNERDLFRQSVGEVKKIQTTTVISHAPRKLKTRVKQPDFTELGVLAESHNIEPVSGDDRLFFTREGVSEKILRQLKRGNMHCQEELDLHHFTVNEAEQLLYHFLNDCLEHGIRWVRIVHGKGSTNPSIQPILKNQINNWLRQHPQILAFASAQNKDGGTGAVYVLLKRKR